MTVSDPGAGQQQGREVCGWRREGVPTMACILTPNHGTLMPHALGVPAPSPTPPARDSGRDEAREAVVEAIVRVVREEGLLDPERVNSPELTADCLRGSLLALPELAKLLRRPA